MMSVSVFPSRNTKHAYRLFSLIALNCAGAILFCTAPAHAQLINGSFENGNFTGTNPHGDSNVTQILAGGTNITGWTAVNEISWNQNGNPYGILALDGTRVVDLTGYHDSQPSGGVQQAVTLIPGVQYTLSLSVGYDSSLPESPDGVTATVAGFSQTFNNDDTGAGTTVGTTFWKSFSFNFTPTVASTSVLIQGSSASIGTFIGLDSVSLAPTATPEPGSMALLMGMGLSGAAFFARRRRKQTR